MLEKHQIIFVTEFLCNPAKKLYIHKNYAHYFCSFLGDGGGVKTELSVDVIKLHLLHQNKNSSCHEEQGIMPGLIMEKVCTIISE